ncbi:MAG: hypothetical protein QW279_00215 [Candidatus Jordarchaeaceae archaeon]
MPHRMLVAANKLAKAIYGKSALELSKVKSWYKAISYIGAVLRSQNIEYQFFDILPIKKEKTAEQLLAGQLAEKDILSEHFSVSRKIKSAKNLLCWNSHKNCRNRNW